LAVWIENVAELARARRAHFQARRISARPRALNAEMAFLHHTLPAWTIPKIGHLRIKLVLRNRRLGEVESPRPIRTRGFAITTADAPVVIDHRDAVLLLP